MTLAKELLEKDEREVVLSYLRSCAKFWKMGSDKLEGWIATVKGGGTPDFSSNLASRKSERTRASKLRIRKLPASRALEHNLQSEHV